MALFTKFQKLAISITAITGAAFFYLDVKQKKTVFNDASTLIVDRFRHWDSNWDFRAPLHHEDEKAEQKFKTRHILLIRHGDYYKWGADDIERVLTDKGIKQATYTAERLTKLNFFYTDLVISTMTRAQQTGSIILEAFQEERMKVNVSHSNLLREGCPHPGSPPTKLKFDIDDARRIEDAFRKYFFRADEKQCEDSCTVMVCHANIIRYFVCRALQLPEDAWTRFSLNHASITWLSIESDGRVILRTFGDSGHIPSNLVTYPKPKMKQSKILKYFA